MAFYTANFSSTSLMQQLRAAKAAEAKAVEAARIAEIKVTKAMETMTIESRSPAIYVAMSTVPSVPALKSISDYGKFTLLELKNIVKAYDLKVSAPKNKEQYVNAITTFVQSRM